MKQIIILLTILLVAFTAAAEDVKVPVKLDPTGFQGNLADAGKALVAGQPTSEGLKRAKEMGVTTIINLRTPGEMSRIEGYDEAAEAAALGMSYVQIPLGGSDHPYTPDALEQFAAALKASGGKALVHCASAYRASHMWAAYLAKHEGMELNEAVAHGRAINLGIQPVEALLGGPVTYSQ